MLEGMKDVLEQCEHFKTKYLRIDGIPKELATTPQGYKQFAKELNEKAKEAKSHGLKAMYHFHTFEFIKLGDKKGIDILMEETDPEVIQILPDTHWIHCAGMNVADFLLQYKDRYDFVHFKDIAIVARDESMNPRPIVYAPVGHGNLNWEPIIKVCKENKVLNYAIEQDDLYGKDPFSEVKLSFEYMESKGI
jgi:sugar phosphate isomerase/epimerase